MTAPSTALRLHCPPAPPVVLHGARTAAPDGVDDLLCTARRAGARRQILIVSRVLGKHLAVAPGTLVSAGERLADLVRGQAPDADTVIGFAETATALAHVLRARLGASAFTHTTRQPVGTPPILTFSEPHSHAPDHTLFHRDPTFLSDSRPVVLVDDELTTGTTALNLIAAIQAHQPHDSYVIAVLTDLRSPQARRQFDATAERMGVPVTVVSLLAAQMVVEPDGITGLAPPAPAADRTGGWSPAAVIDDAPLPVVTGHLGWDDHDERTLQRWAGTVAARLAVGDGTSRIAVIGWEEAMYAPLALARHLPGTVTVRSTTRSPIAPATTPGYPIRDGIAFDVGDGTPRYLYNLDVDPPDHIVLCSPGPPPPALAARLAGVAPLHLVDLAATSVHDGGPDPDHLPDPPAGFGSYAPDDVTFLLTPLPDAFEESSLAEREQALEEGAHYSERLPLEYEPSADYLRLFRDVLDRQAAVVATLVGLTARRILQVHGDRPVVLVSLARAGTPVGVLLRRYLRLHHGRDIPHRSISIIRDRGIDRTAIAWLRQQHPGARLQFVDGWTGKGAIQRELTAEARVLGLDDRMAVLADPGGCAALPGTRADVLIPSACLNATVSGLVSRTVLTRALQQAGGFHGAKHYQHLADVDLSGHFVDEVSRRFVAPAALPAAHHDADPPDPGAVATPWTGYAGALDVAAAHGITDLNLVKPGLGEAIRVLLRRRPRLLLLRDEGADVQPLLQLARERQVAVEIDPDLHVAACGLIA